MAARMTLQFNQAEHGWTETWYTGDTAPPSVISTQLSGLFAKAVAFRAPLTKLVAVRFSIIGKPGVNRSFRLNGLVASQENTDATPDVVSTDVLYKIYGAANARRNIFIRGIPDPGVIRAADGTFILGAELKAGITAYMRAAKAFPLFVAQTQTPALGGQPEERVIQIKANQTTDGVTDVTFDPGIVGIAKGVQVQFKGSWDRKKLPGFPLKARVIGYTAGVADIIQIPYQMPSTLAVFPASMRVGLFTFQLNSIESWDFQSFSERKTGRPFGSLRGRRPAAFARH